MVFYRQDMTLVNISHPLRLDSFGLFPNIGGKVEDFWEQML